jgi:hypothetical protein
VESDPFTVQDVPPQHSGWTRQATGYVVGGVGVAALITGSVFGARALSKNAELVVLCGSQLECQKTFTWQDLSDDRYTYTVASDVAIGAGLVGVGVGLYLLMTDSPRREPPPVLGKLTIAPLLGHQKGVALRTVF